MAIPEWRCHPFRSNDATLRVAANKVKIGTLIYDEDESIMLKNESSPTNLFIITVLKNGRFTAQLNLHQKTFIPSSICRSF